MARVEGRALADDVLFAPGNVFSVSQSAGSFMRFNVAMMEDPKIFRVLQSAMTECAAGIVKSGRGGGGSSVGASTSTGY